MRPKPLLILLLLVSLAGATGYWYFSNNPDEWQQVLEDFGLTELGFLPAAEDDALSLTATGFIEAKETSIASEIGGRVIGLAVKQGEAVSAGQAVISLDTSFLAAQKEQIQAQIALAEAQLDQLRAGTPDEARALAEAALVLAQAQRDAADKAWQNAILLRDTPQQLEAQIASARSQVQISKLQMEQAAVLRDAFNLQEDIAKQVWDQYQALPLGDDFQASADWNLATMDIWGGTITWERAQAAYTAAQNRLATLLQLKEEPHQAQLLVTQAMADREAKAVAVEVAQAALEQVLAPVPAGQISTLEARLEQARAQLDTLAIQAEKYTLVSTLDGIITQQMIHQGEIATPGITLLTVANLDEVGLSVYVAESDYGRLGEGQVVQVSVDSYPQELFPGLITSISHEAEFTPKNVQTREERVSLVYAVSITVPNAAHKLRPGVPADVEFIEAQPR